VLAGRKSGVRVLDPAGRELTRRAGPHSRLVASASGALAVLAADGKVFECRLAGTPVWTELPVPVAAPHLVLDLVYRGAELDLLATNGVIFGWNGARVFPRGQVERITGGMSVAGTDTLIVPGPEGQVHYLNDAVRGTLRLPSVLPYQRVTARPGSRRLMAIGDGLIVGFDLASVIPHALPQLPGIHAVFVDDRTLLVNRGAIEWHWMDVDTGARTTFTHVPHGHHEIVEIDAIGGRVLVHESIGSPQRLVLFRRGSPEVRVVAEGRTAWARLIPGEAMVFGIGDGRVFARIGEAAPREVAKLDGVTDGAMPLGYRRFAAHSTSGEIVRVDLTTDAVERARVADGSSGFVAADGAGRVLVAEGRRLLVWDGAITEVARFDQPIQRLDRVDGGVVAVHLSDFEVHTIDLGPAGAQPVRVLAPGKGFAQASFDGKLLVGLGPSQQVNVVELPSRARWTLPILFDGKDLLAVSPSTRRVLQGADRHFVIWTLPHAGPDLGAWLDELTNATIDGGGVLAWPWQRPRAP
jgi:hypothetical protein